MHRPNSKKALTTLTLLSFLVLAPLPKSQSAPCISSAAIDAYLQAKSSPLGGTGNIFIANGLQSNVDPRLIVAIAGAESSFGTRICADFNAWNWFWCYGQNTCGANPCGNSPFNSWEEGITSVTRGIRRYFNRGYTTIPLIGGRYCADGCENWVPNVTRFYRDDLGGDTTNLQFPCQVTTPPAPVQLFSHIPCTTVNYLNAFWSRNNEPTFASYKLYRANHPNVTTADQLLITVTNNNPFSFYYRDNNLTPGMYYYKVFVFNQSGQQTGSNEFSGKILASGEVTNRIPGAPEPGDTAFPPNVAIPNSVFDLSQFDCDERIEIDPVAGCVGPITVIGPLVDCLGHISKFRFFSSVTIQNSTLNGFPNFEFITHLRDNISLRFFAQDDSYIFIQPDYGFSVNIPQGTQGRIDLQVTATG